MTQEARGGRGAGAERRFRWADSCRLTPEPHPRVAPLRSRVPPLRLLSCYVLLFSTSHAIARHLLPCQQTVRTSRPSPAVPNTGSDGWVHCITPPSPPPLSPRHLARVGPTPLHLPPLEPSSPDRRLIGTCQACRTGPRTQPVGFRTSGIRGGGVYVKGRALKASRIGPRPRRGAGRAGGQWACPRDGVRIHAPPVRLQKLRVAPAATPWFSSQPSPSPSLNPTSRYAKKRILDKPYPTKLSACPHARSKPHQRYQFIGSMGKQSSGDPARLVDHALPPLGSDRSWPRGRGSEGDTPRPDTGW